jgi:TolB-like protein
MIKNLLRMKKITSILTLLILAASPALAKRMRILVHPFENNGSDKYSWISDGMTDTVISDLNRIRNISAVSDKDRIKAFNEISLGQTGLISEKTAVKVSEMTGANLIFTGSYFVHDDRIRVIAKLMRVSTGDIAKSVKIDGSLKLLFDVQDKIIIKLMTETEKLSLSDIEPVKFEDIDIKRIYQKKRPNKRAYMWYSKGLGMYHTNPHKALNYYLKAVKIDPDYWEALYRTGWLYCDLNRFSESLSYLSRAKSLLERRDGHQNTSDYAETIKYFGIVYEYKNQYDQALEYYFRAKRIRDNLKLQNNSEYATTINNIGSAYYSKGKNDLALEYFFNAKRIRDQLGLKNTLEYAILMHNIGDLYYKNLNKPCEGARYMRKCVEIEERLGNKDADSDRKYFKKIESDCKK